MEDIAGFVHNWLMRLKCQGQDYQRNVDYKIDQQVCRSQLLDFTIILY